MEGDASTRQHRRIGVNLWVSHESVESFRADQADNLSEGGIFICTSRPLPIGTVVYMNVRLGEADEAPLHAVGEVVWHREHDGAAGMGVTFTRIADADKTRLARFIDQRDQVG